MRKLKREKAYKEKKKNRIIIRKPTVEVVENKFSKALWNNKLNVTDKPVEINRVGFDRSLFNPGAKNG